MSRGPWRALGWGAVGAAAAAVSIAVADGSGPDPSGRVRFSHRRHAAYVDDCAACHPYTEPGAMPGAEHPAPEFERPAERACRPCHPFERPWAGRDRDEPDAAVCSMCHPTDERGHVALPLVAPIARTLNFDHRRHDERSGARCRKCHDEAQADSGRPPTMARCMTCHEEAATAACGTCHPTDERGLLDTDLPDGRTLVPPEWMGELAHTETFDRTHGDVARSQAALCGRCHEETACQGCHLGVATERRFHGAGWYSTHSAAARSNDLECTTCHRGQETCLECHRRAGVTWDSPEIGRTVPRGSSFHAPDWRDDRTLHAREARRGLDTCVSCHAERDCLACHRWGISPHGAGFGPRCRALSAENPDLCVRCHDRTPACL